MSDRDLQESLAVYAGMVGWVLTDPERWLGIDPGRGRSSAAADAEGDGAKGGGGAVARRGGVTGVPGRAVRFARRRLFGAVTPASARWSQQSLRFRIRWWVRRIELSAGLAAAAPRFAGMLADRVPLQAALGASSAGLAVCAVAREHGIHGAKDWVPLLAQVVFDRPLTPGGSSEVDTTEAERRLEAAAGDPTEPPSGLAVVAEAVQRSVRALWGLARALLDVQRLLDRRPRGNLVVRGLAKLPVVGVFGGWLDERGGTRRAARRTHKILAAR